MTQKRTDAREKLWTPDYVIVMAASLGISMCNYFFFSTLPLYAQKMTGSAALAGLMTGAYTLAALAVRPLAGSLSDRIGRTRLLIAGAALCALSCLCYRLAPVLALLLAVRALHGVGFGVHSTAGGAVAADVIPKSRMGEGIGYFGLYGTIAAAVAPGIALAIVDDGRVESFGFLFFLSAAVSAASAALDCCIGYERKAARTRAAKPAPSAVPAAAGDRAAAGAAPGEGRKPTAGPPTGLPKTYLGFEAGVLQPALVLVLLYVGLSGVTSFLSLFALDRKLGNVGLFFTVNAAGLFLSRVLLGRLSDERGPGIVVIPGVAVLAACLAAIPFARSLAFLYALAFPLGLAQGAVGPALNALMFDRCSASRRGTASAAYFSAIDVGYGIGSIALGFVAAGLGYYAVYALSAAAAVAALLVYALGLGRSVAPRRG